MIFVNQSPQFVDLLRSPRNRFPAWRAGTTTLFVVPARARLHRLAESIPRKRFLGSINVYKYGLCSPGRGCWRWSAGWPLAARRSGRRPSPRASPTRSRWPSYQWSPPPCWAGTPAQCAIPRTLKCLSQNNNTVLFDHFCRTFMKVTGHFCFFVYPLPPCTDCPVSAFWFFFSKNLRIKSELKVVNWKNANYRGFSLRNLDTVWQKFTFINWFFTDVWYWCHCHFFSSCSLSPVSEDPFHSLLYIILYYTYYIPW